MPGVSDRRRKDHVWRLYTSALGGDVIHYRLYSLNGLGRIQSAEDLLARDDDHAVALVEQRRAWERMELWQGVRLVMEFAPTAPE